MNNKLDELQSQFNSINNKEITLKSKVVTLETDNDHYLTKIHQYEEEVTDLKDNLENTLESLITTQNDFEEYKNKKEEELERLKKILQEEKDNVKALMSKKLMTNKIQLNTPNDEIENLKNEIKQENFKENVRLRGKNMRRKNIGNQDNTSYNKNELFEKLRKRKENLIKLNQKIKEEKEKLKLGKNSI